MKNLEKFKSEAIFSSTLYYEKKDLEKFIALFTSLEIIDPRLSEYVNILSEMLSAGQFDELFTRPANRRRQISEMVRAKISLIPDAKFRAKMESWFEAALAEDFDIELQEELLYRYCWAEFLDKVETMDKSNVSFQEKLNVKPTMPKINEKMVKSLLEIEIPHEEEEASSTVFPTGIDGLDELVKMRRTNFVVVAARTTIGKSLFMINHAINLAKNDTKILYVSLEESNVELKKRVLMHLEGLDAIDKNKVEKNFIVFTPNNSSPNSVLGEIEKITSDQEIAVVFLDYIQLLKYTGMSDWDSLRALTRELKLFAVRANLLLVTASQLKREVEYTGSNLAGLYGSSTIEADANVILILEPVRRQNIRQNNTSVIAIMVAKNRSGAQGKLDNILVDYSTGHVLEQ